jgi:hypothetical protein
MACTPDNDGRHAMSPSKVRTFAHFCRVLTWTMMLTLVAGCSSLLPSSRSETEAPWKTFKEVKSAFDSIEPGQTTLVELKQLGYDPFLNSNVTLLHYSDVLGKYAPHAVRDDFVEPGIRQCLQARIQCSAFSIDHRQVQRDRVGNFFLDFINYRRRTQISGWRFAAVIVVVNDVVVFKSWTGMPAISEAEETVQPLGPLQDRGPSMLP